MTMGSLTNETLEAGDSSISNKEEENDTKSDSGKIAPNFLSIPYGFQLRIQYVHNKKLTDFVDVCFNPRLKQFILLDTRGITTWTKDGISNTVSRSLSFPKYINNLLRSIIYAQKHNVYFCLAQDFSLKVLNKDFQETCTADSDLSSVMFMLFNPIRDELITGGVQGIKVWEFRQIADRIWIEIKAMANYGLFLKKELEGVGGSWVRKMDLNEHLQHLYCCSDTEVLCYDMDGKYLFKLSRAHTAQINGCKYSPQARVLVTCSYDTEVKVWSLTGGLVHTFRGHSRAVTSLVLHPETSTLVLTASMDGTVRVWSLDIMEQVYCIVMSTDGIPWMGLTEDCYLWTSTRREVSIWNLNQTIKFYALARSKITEIMIARAHEKTSRVVAVGDDSSIRLVSMREQRNLSTVLPPPSISPLQNIKAITYNRECSLMYLLISPQEIWVYTMRTDPACRTAVWDVSNIQERINKIGRLGSSSARSTPVRQSVRPTSGVTAFGQLQHVQARRATQQGRGSPTPCPCTALTCVSRSVMYWTEEGYVCPLQTNFLVLGLEDGRILFLDPIKFGHRYCELQACRDPILNLCNDYNNNCLIVHHNLRNKDQFQIWSLPQLNLTHEVLVRVDVTSVALLGETFLSGHEDGSVILHHLQRAATDSGFSFHSVTKKEDVTNTEDKRDHDGAVLSVDSCPRLGIYLSCSGDGIIKIWNGSKTLCTEISLEDTLTSACFLNDRGDILIGYLNHLFQIDHSKVLSFAAMRRKYADDLMDTESEIYEDPAVKYEGAAANPDPITLETYLVPFNLDFSEHFLGGRESPVSSENGSEKAEGDAESDSDVSMAPTDIYHSPTSTPRRLSLVDLTVSGDAITREELRNKAPVIIVKKQHHSRVVVQKESTDYHTADYFDMPVFGTSPGPSPTPTPPSSVSDFDMSERESEEESEEDTEEEETAPTPTDKKSEGLFDIPVEIPEPPKPVKDESFRLKDEDMEPFQPRYSLSAMKIDIKSLFKERGSSFLAKATIPKPLPLSSISLVQQEKQPAQASITSLKDGKKSVTPKKEIQKKKPKAVRSRVRPRSVNQAGGNHPSATEVDAQEEQQLQDSSTTTVSAKSTATISLPQSTEVKATHVVLSSPSATIALNKASPSTRDATELTNGSEDPTKRSKGKKKTSIFSNLRRSSGKKGKDGKAQEDAESDKEEEDKSTEMAKMAVRAAIAKKYNPLERVGSSNSKASLHTPTPIPEIEDEELPQTAPRHLGRSHSAVQSRAYPLPPESRAKSAGTKVHFADTMLERPFSPSADFCHSATFSSEKLDSITEPSEFGGSVILSESEVDNLRESIIDISVKHSSEVLSTGMESLRLGQPSQTSTVESMSLLSPADGGSGRISELSFGLTEDNADITESRAESIPLNVLEKKLPFSSELEGRLARPNTAEGERRSKVSIMRRPYTAGAQMHVTFLEENANGPLPTSVPLFDIYPSISPAEELFSYSKNDGLSFEKNWQEKMIERHHHLQMQRAMRAQSAADRRRLLELRKRQKRKALLGHHMCTSDIPETNSPGLFTRSDSSLHSMRSERTQSAPPTQMRDTWSPPVMPKEAFQQIKPQRNYGTEKSFRLRISKETLPPAVIMESPEQIFLPNEDSSARLKFLPRPHTGKSIPSKARRYMLVSHNRSDPDILGPSPLEAHLLAKRFPKTTQRIIKQARRPSHRNADQAVRVGSALI